MKKIANYTINGVIGTGGMGQVLRGLDPFGRKVAIKEILPEYVDNAEYRKRINREIKVMQTLSDPNVVKVYQSFELNGCLYIVMELVDGVTIEQYVEKNGVFSFQEACNIMHKLLGTMQYVHNNGIIHRDLKPGNVMIRSNGELCLLDFGIAKDTSREVGDEERTQLGTVLGTDGYMSPEQANGFALDKRSDIYSLGCVMFYLLTGRHAYMTYSGDDGRTATEICTLPFPQVSDFRSDLPEGVQLVLDKATEKNMMRRYQSCREFSDDITAKCENPQPEKAPEEEEEKLKISVGRDNCDITTPLSIKNISRHHCDIEVIPMPSGEAYRITDHSKNGTVVNGETIKEGEHTDILPGQTPVIYLSTEPLYALDWKTVLRTIAAMRGEILPPETPEFPEPVLLEVPEKGMSFIEAIKSCFNKYAYFRGRAPRSEYWYFYLFNAMVSLLLFIIGLLSMTSEGSYSVFFWILSIFYYVAVFLPNIAVTVRRFHDTDRSAMNLLWVLLGPIGAIIIFVFMLLPGTPGPNQYGPEP